MEMNARSHPSVSSPSWAHCADVSPSSGVLASSCVVLKAHSSMVIKYLGCLSFSLWTACFISSRYCIIRPMILATDEAAEDPSHPMRSQAPSGGCSLSTTSSSPTRSPFGVVCLQLPSGVAAVNLTQGVEGLFIIFVFFIDILASRGDECGDGSGGSLAGSKTASYAVDHFMGGTGHSILDRVLHGRDVNCVQEAVPERAVPMVTRVELLLFKLIIPDTKVWNTVTSDSSRCLSIADKRYMVCHSFKILDCFSFELNHVPNSVTRCSNEV